jgi:hypothetical protein
MEYFVAVLSGPAFHFHVRSSIEHIVTIMTTARQRFSMYVPANTQQQELCSLWTMLELVARLHNNSDNRRGVYYVVRAIPSSWQRSCKHVSLIEEGCFLCGPCRGYIMSVCG